MTTIYYIVLLTWSSCNFNFTSQDLLAGSLHCLPSLGIKIPLSDSDAIVS